MPSSSLIEQAAEVIPNRFALSRILSKRIRQLRGGGTPQVEVEEKTPLMEIALKEIIENKLHILGIDNELETKE